MEIFTFRRYHKSVEKCKPDAGDEGHPCPCFRDMKEFAKSFYLSGTWRKVRDSYKKRHFGICERCGRPGEIVHHKKYLTPENIGNPDISLSDDNLELLCRECHALEHMCAPAVADGLGFNADGELVEVNKSGEDV